LTADCQLAIRKKQEKRLHNVKRNLSNETSFIWLQKPLSLVSNYSVMT